MTGEPYGAKGCACWPNEDYNPWDDRTTEYLPNSGCRFHGVLAEFLPPRDDTGVYRIVRDGDEIKAAELQGKPFPPHLIPKPLDLPGVDLSAAHRWDRGCEPADFHEAHHPADGSRCPGDPHLHVPNEDGEPVCVPGFDDVPSGVVELGPEPITVEEANAIARRLLDNPTPRDMFFANAGWDRWGEYHESSTPVQVVTNGKDGRGIFAALRRWGRNTLNAVTNSGRGWL